ncbi:hypothetical protein BDN72DRAFT_962412 [Pluteus cervinus]|uniref:Uncharacterized protein n=1 Tax=Pluteus cervinus TaxID=181527 RepID=A0ACD3AJ45_9AGAR|nr:hypothetical protein BDN72DRAFT_962412 [Pluteus cervinus]
MDQDSFRQLLQAPRAAGSKPPVYGSQKSKKEEKKPKTIDASQPAFKPRKVKNNADAKYRDRAAERRTGGPNDFAEAEALLEEFERQTNKAEIEEKRKYLGGDSEHSILVKGLDMALLEQNKARAAAADDNDEDLEKAYLEASVQKKKTKADLLRELKDKRTNEQQTVASAEDKKDGLEAGKTQGKFKPIGFKPIGGPVEEKSKKKRTKAEGKDGERKKKKRKVDAEGTTAQESSAAGPSSTTTNQEPTKTTKPPPSEPEPVDEDFDIFAGAGDYEGLDLGDDDADDDEPMRAASPRRSRSPGEIDEPSTSTNNQRRQWIPLDDGEQQHPPPTPSAPSKSQATPPPHTLEEGEEEDEEPIRLQPLASSALPSIKDLLALNEAAEADEKRRKRKEKKKKGGGGGGGDGEGKKLDAEAKAERDYKRLKSYTDKKDKKAS